MNKLIEFLPYIIGGYEFIVHTLPTNKNYSLLKKIGMILSIGSDFLNRRKKSGTTYVIIIALAALSSFFVSGCAALKKVECLSVKYVPITFVAKDGYTYTVDMPFCDTVKLFSNKNFDSLTLKK